MKSSSHRFRVGEFECLVVLDGFHGYPHPAEILFVNAPPELLEEELKKRGLTASTWEVWTSPYPGMVIFTGDHIVLIDTGAADFDSTTGRLIGNLQEEKIEPQDIDTVIITHAHPDHIGANVDEAGKPRFPNARYCLFREEWDFWTQSPDLSSLPVPDHIKEILLDFPRRFLAPLRAQVRLLDREGEIVPGIGAIHVPGHTPGHMAVSVTSDGEELVCLADTVLHPIHLSRPDWYEGTVLDPARCVEGRKRLLERIAASGALAHAFHFPFPGLGRVKEKGDGFEWEPIGA